MRRTRNGRQTVTNFFSGKKKGKKKEKVREEERGEVSEGGKVEKGKRLGEQGALMTRVKKDTRRNT